MHRLIGHAIVSADDRIADASGRIPEELHNEADWALFQAALDRAALTLIGRASHEATPNCKNRRRLIVSGCARGLEERADGLWLNPADLPLVAALYRILPDGGEVAVVGGQARVRSRRGRWLRGIPSGAGAPRAAARWAGALSGVRARSTSRLYPSGRWPRRRRGNAARPGSRRHADDLAAPGLTGRPAISSRPPSPMGSRRSPPRRRRESERRARVP